MNEEIDKLIEKRIGEGWEWVPILYAKLLQPPHTDPRRFWASEWVRWKDGHFYPHWINREIDSQS